MFWTPLLLLSCSFRKFKVQWLFYEAHSGGFHYQYVSVFAQAIDKAGEIRLGVLINIKDM